jgi:hypothetical protein
VLHLLALLKASTGLVQYKLSKGKGINNRLNHSLHSVMPIEIFSHTQHIPFRIFNIWQHVSNLGIRHQQAITQERESIQQLSAMS